MNNTDLKFFTNEPERDLYSRFAAILKSNTQFFDVLVGYFRASGFFKMYEALESIEKIASALNVPLSQLFEKLDNADVYESIPLKCYEFFSAKTKAEQEQLYRILLEMDKYKSE